jgi:hypothetical protein
VIPDNSLRKELNLVQIEPLACLDTTKSRFPFSNALTLVWCRFDPQIAHFTPNPALESFLGTAVDGVACVFTIAPPGHRDIVIYDVVRSVKQ